MTPIVEIVAARFTQYTQAMEDEDARRLQWLSTEKKMQLTISSSKTDLVQKVKLDKDSVCIFFFKISACVRKYIYY